MGPNALVTHPKLTTDAFALYIKGSVILGKVKFFNRTFRYRYTDGVEAGQNATKESDSDPAVPRPINDVTSIKPQDTDEFKALDGLIEAFISNIPREFRDPVGLNSGTKLDPILYMAHLLPHMSVHLLYLYHAMCLDI